MNICSSGSFGYFVHLVHWFARLHVGFLPLRPSATGVNLLHFALVVDDEKCIVFTRVCVCLSAAACLHYCMDPDVTWGVVGMPPSCALSGGFAIGARVALLWQHNANAKC